MPTVLSTRAIGALVHRHVATLGGSAPERQTITHLADAHDVPAAQVERAIKTELGYGRLVRVKPPVGPTELRRPERTQSAA